MELIVQKLGDAVGLAIPEAMLRDLGIALGQSFEMKIGAAGSLVLEPRTATAARKKYTAAQLNALCKFDEPMPPDLLAWDSMAPTGLESL
jgi:antitoxin component of MazEF toxin-antitoxin module